MSSMSRRGRRALVVDASVARAAGETEHPRSKACRDFLTAILDICHRVVVNPVIRGEWKRHQSRFTSKWRVSMAARRKPLNDHPAAPTGLRLEEFPESARKAIEKDLCLIETALAADKEIVTLDRKLYEALGEAPSGERVRDEITWHDPVVDGTAKLGR